jgi:hypothetical protein
MIHKMTWRGQILRFLFGCVLAGMTLMSQSVSLYRCDKNGAIEFRQTACEAGRQRSVQVVNESGGLTPSTPALRVVEVPERVAESARQRTTRLREARCWKKRRQLDRVERKLRTGYKASEYQPLHDRQREYEDFLRRFCP